MKTCHINGMKPSTATSTYVYFTYDHSEQHIHRRVDPERCNPDLEALRRADRVIAVHDDGGVFVLKDRYSYPGMILSPLPGYAEVSRRFSKEFFSGPSKI